MAYVLKQITIRTDKTEKGIQKIDEVWGDIKNGKLPLLFDSNHVFQENLATISKYSNYEKKDLGEFDLTIMGGSADFYEVLEMKTNQGLYKKYVAQEEHGDVSLCVKEAWEKVWADQEAGIISRTYTEDFESSTPTEYTQSKKVCCTVYVAIQ